MRSQEVGGVVCNDTHVLPCVCAGEDVCDTAQMWHCDNCTISGDTKIIWRYHPPYTTPFPAPPHPVCLYVPSMSPRSPWLSAGALWRGGEVVASFHHCAVSHRSQSISYHLLIFANITKYKYKSFISQFSENPTFDIIKRQNPGASPPPTMTYFMIFLVIVTSIFVFTFNDLSW